MKTMPSKENFMDGAIPAIITDNGDSGCVVSKKVKRRTFSINIEESCEEWKECNDESFSCETGKHNRNAGKTDTICGYVWETRNRLFLAGSWNSGPQR